MPIFAAVAVHEVDDALPRGDVLVVPDAGAARRDAALGETFGHLGEHEAGAADRAAAEVHEMPSRRACRRSPSTCTSATRRCGWQMQPRRGTA
jgi:hypothetical protein